VVRPLDRGLSLGRSGSSTGATDRPTGCRGHIKVSNELSNYCGADRQPPLDDPGSFGAPSLAIDDHLRCFTPKRSLVRTHYRPRRSQSTALPLRPWRETASTAADIQAGMQVAAALVLGTVDEVSEQRFNAVHDGGNGWRVPRVLCAANRHVHRSRVCDAPVRADRPERRPAQPPVAPAFMRTSIWRRIGLRYPQRD
jgi:hypothetical protein